MVYVGLPASGASQSRPGRLRVSASLVAAGEVYVRATAASVAGALVLGEGLTFGEGAALELPGEHLPNHQRQRVPGFGRSGPLRPGVLTAGRYRR